MIKRILLILAVIAILMPTGYVLASDTSTALYRATITVSNNSTATTNVATVFTGNTSAWMDVGYVNSTCNNTAMLSAAAADLPYMPGYVGYPWCVWVPSIGENSYINDYLYMGGEDDMDGKIRYFPDPSANMTTSDHASLEPSDNFTYEASGWVDTTAGASKYIVQKEDALEVYVSPSVSGNITADIYVEYSDYSYASEGGLYWSDVVYNTCWVSATGLVDDADNAVSVGQLLGFTIYRASPMFDTSDIPDDAVIASAEMKIYGAGDLSVDDFDIVVTNGQPTYPHDPLVVGDYNKANYSGSGGSLNTSTWTLAGYNTITLNSTGRGWINKAGITKLTLRSQEDINGSQPVNNESVQYFTSRQAGTDKDPILEILYYVPVSATGISSGEITVDVALGDRPDFDDWSTVETVGVSFGAGLLPCIILDEIELTAPAASVTFSDIGTMVSNLNSALSITSRHLVVMVNAASTDAVTNRWLQCRFNGDTGTNYNQQDVYGAGAGSGSSRYNSQTEVHLGYIPGTSYANAFGGVITLIPHAFNTANHKSFLTCGGAVEDVVSPAAGRWASANAVASILLYPSGGGDFATGSTFQLAIVDERYLVEEDYNAGADFVVDFNGIAGTGDDLVVIGYGRSDRAAVEDEVLQEINADAVGGNYPSQELIGRGAVAPTAGNPNQEVAMISGNTATANAFGALCLFYSEYAEATNDPCFMSLSGYHELTGATSEIRAMSGRRNNVAAITRVELYPNVGANFKAGSLFSLYRVPQYLIERQELAAPVASITFSTIPQGYEALQLNIYARSDNAAVWEFINVEFNGDAVAANYDYQYLDGSGAAVSAQRGAASGDWLQAVGNTEGANEFGNSLSIIPQYSKTDRHKHLVAMSARNENTVRLYSCRWESTNAITQIVLTPSVGTNFLAGSIFELVGVMPSHTFSLSIDGEVRAVVDGNGISVPDNNNDWLSFQNNVMPYVEYQEITVGGVQKQYVDWEYGATFTDSSGNGNDATPTFRTTSSDADVSAELVAFAPVSTARAPAYSVADAPFFYTANITTTGNFTSGDAPAGGPPGSAVIDEAAEAGGTPNIWLWGLLAIFSIAIIGLFISWLEKKHGSGGGTLIARVVVAVIVFGLLIAFSKFDWWMLVLYLIIVAAIIMWSQHREWGGSVTQHGLIGFLASTWVGLTLINRIMESQFLTIYERSWANTFAFTQEFKAFDVFSVPVLNFSFFTQGIPSLMKWDYTFFGGNAQLFQYLLYSLTAVVSFIIFGILIGILFNAFRAR